MYKKPSLHFARARVERGMLKHFFSEARMKRKQNFTDKYGWLLRRASASLAFAVYVAACLLGSLFGIGFAMKLVYPVVGLLPLALILAAVSIALRPAFRRLERSRRPALRLLAKPLFCLHAYAAVFAFLGLLAFLKQTFLD